MPPGKNLNTSAVAQLLRTFIMVSALTAILVACGSSSTTSANTTPVSTPAFKPDKESLNRYIAAMGPVDQTEAAFEQVVQPGDVTQAQADAVTTPFRDAVTKCSAILKTGPWAPEVLGAMVRTRIQADALVAALSSVHAPNPWTPTLARAALLFDQVRSKASDLMGVPGT